MKRTTLSLSLAMLILTPIIVMHGWSIAEAEHTSSEYLDPKITFDDIIPTVDYGALGLEDIGKQYPPVNVANKCMFYFSHSGNNETAYSYGLYVAQWLALRGHESSDSVYFTSDFPWPTYNLTAGWKSALAQAHAAECFLDAYSYTGNTTFLDLARKSLMFISVPIEQGGVLIDESNSRWWYEEYPRPSESDQPRVLNGHQFVLISLNNYLQVDDDPTLRQLFNNGLNALKFDALMYDYGYNNSFYDRLKREPANVYHATHILNFQKLYDITGDVELLELKNIFME